MRKFLSNIYSKYPALLIVIPLTCGIISSYCLINPLEINSLIIILVQVLLILLLIFSFVKINDIYLKCITVLIITFTFSFIRFNYTYISYSKYDIGEKINDLKNKTVKLYGYLIEQPDLSENRLKLIINPDSIAMFNETIPVNGKVVVSIFKNEYSESKLSRFEYGDYVEITGNVEALPHRRNPGEFDYGEFLKLHGIDASFTSFGFDKIKIVGSISPGFKKTIIYPVKKYILDKIDDLIGGDEGDFLKGLLLGERSNLSKEIKGNLVNNGLSHLIAVSGLNVAYVLIIISIFLQLFPVNNNIKIIITILALIFYMYLAGNVPSVTRATIIACVYLLSILTERKTIPFNVISVAAIIILLVDPRQLFSAGFILTFWAVLSVILIYPKLEKLITNRKFYSKISGDNILHKLYKVLILMLIGTIAIQIGTIPITALMFKKISLISLFTNMVAIPVSNLAMAMGFILIILTLVSNYVATLAAFSSSFVLNLLLKFISFFANLNFSFFETFDLDLLFLACFYLVVVVLLFIPKIKIFPRIIISILIILNYLTLNSINSINTKLYLAYLDVGNSSACFISTPGNYNVLINAGTFSKNYSSAESSIIPFLKFRNKDHLDLLIVTTLDKDEARNLIKLASAFKINKIIIPEAYKFVFENSFVKERIPSLNIYFVSKACEISETGELRIFIMPSNKINDNLIVKVFYGNEKYVFTDFRNSDIYYENLLENSETAILKVPSSGSFNLIPPEIITGINPKKIIISARKENKKLNSDIFSASLEKYGFEVYKTFQNGAIIFESDGTKTDLVNW